MIFVNGKDSHHSPIAIDLDVQAVLDKMPQKGNPGSLREEAAVVLDTARRIWSPALVLRCMSISSVSSGRVTLAGNLAQIDAQLRMGHAATFLKPASRVVLGAYTVGRELEQASANAAADKDYLESYLYEVVARAALSRLGTVVSALVEEEAASLGIGVGPLLSPGSVHGWELVEQKHLCNLLDLDSAGIRCLENGVLTPFNSLSFIIGIGNDYERTKVGSPCEVCNNRERCELKSGGEKLPKQLVKDRIFQISGTEH